MLSRFRYGADITDDASPRRTAVLDVLRNEAHLGTRHVSIERDPG